MKTIHTLTCRSILFSIGLILIIGCNFSIATAAFADSTTATATISSGTLSEVNSTTPSISTTLNGTDQIPTYPLAITATDPSGTGAGWNLTITSTTFNTGGGTPKYLANTASEVIGISASCNGGSSCTSPTNSIGYPLTVPAAHGSSPTAVKFINAASGTGLGQFTVTPTIGVSIPANTVVGTYTSTVTLAINSGP